MLGESWSFGCDLLGPYIRVCARNRQMVCRDQECTGMRLCKAFPAELMPAPTSVDGENANGEQ